MIEKPHPSLWIRLLVRREGRRGGRCHFVMPSPANPLFTTAIVMRTRYFLPPRSGSVGSIVSKTGLIGLMLIGPFPYPPISLLVPPDRDSPLSPWSLPQLIRVWTQLLYPLERRALDP